MLVRCELDYIYIINYQVAIQKHEKVLDTPLINSEWKPDLMTSGLQCSKLIVKLFYPIVIGLK